MIKNINNGDKNSRTISADSDQFAQELSDQVLHYLPSVNRFYKYLWVGKTQKLNCWDT